MRHGALLSSLVFVGVVGCVSEEEYDAVLGERDALRSRIAELEDEVDKQKGRVKELEKNLKSSSMKKVNRPPEAQIAAALSELAIGRTDKLRAKFDTSMGPIDCELLPQVAPNTVLNFVALAEGKKEWTDPKSGEKTKEPLYDGTKFHRVIKNFMIQGGDPLGTGQGGPGYRFGDEVWPDVRFDRPGVLAMANAGPNTNGSQFFITNSKPSHLNGRHTIFGLCDLETVVKIMDVEVGGADGSTPKKDVVLKKLTIVRDRDEDKKDGK